MSEYAGDCLGSLYIAVGQNERQRLVLDELVERAGYGWRCEAVLAGVEEQSCEYMNVPLLVGRPDDGRCANCGTPRPRQGAI